MDASSPSKTRADANSELSLSDKDREPAVKLTNAYSDSVKPKCSSERLLNKVGDTVLEIIFPQDNKVRSRKIVTRSRARPTGKFPSGKMGRMVQWESHNELNAYRLLEANSAVFAYHEQPLIIRFSLDGENHIHYPDVLVHCGQSHELWEIKPATQANHPSYVARTRFLEATLPEFGFVYRMIFAEELAKQPRLDNVLKFLKYGREPVSDTARERVRLLLMEVPYITWETASSGELGSDGRAVLSRLVLEGKLSCDFDRHLIPSTRLSLVVVPQVRSLI